MHVVTSGKPFLDIDGYAGIVAYAELLQKQGKKAIGVSTSKLNGSIPPTVRSWNAPFTADYTANADDTFIIIDTCDPGSFDAIVSEERIEAIIDHHPGLEAFWQEKIGKKTHIELVGAACTLVYEHWFHADLLGQMSQTSARLLICGILDNTLNFGAKISGERDVKAYNALTKIANLPANWPAQYFTECQELLLSHIPNAVDDDFKSMVVAGWKERIPVGQLCLWDARALLNTHLDEVKQLMGKKGDHWFTNIISISDNRSHIVCEDPKMQAWLADLLGMTFVENIATADRLWLRKEIMKQAIDRNS